MVRVKKLQSVFVKSLIKAPMPLFSKLNIVSFMADHYIKKRFYIFFHRLKKYINGVFSKKALKYASRFESRKTFEQTVFNSILFIIIKECCCCSPHTNIRSFNDARYVCDQGSDLRTGSNQQPLAQAVVTRGRSRLTIAQIHAHQPKVRPSEVHAEVSSIL